VGSEFLNPIFFLVMMENMRVSGEVLSSLRVTVVVRNIRSIRKGIPQGLPLNWGKL
jgi:hypothetical protein